MSEVLLPTWIIPEEEPQEPLDEGSSVFRAAFAPGIAQRQSYGGLRLKLSRKHTVRAEEKAQLLSTLRATRGSYNALRTKVHFALRGSFPATELLSNNTFASGTTGWTCFSDIALASADRILRSTRIANSGVTQALLRPSANPTVTQYAPHVWRVFVSGLRYPASLAIDVQTTEGQSASFTDAGLKTLAFVPRATSVDPRVIDTAVVGMAAGDFVDFSYASLSRCALVDNGPNLLLRSDELDNAAWTKSGATIPAAATAPDGTATADFLREDSSLGQHYALQTPVAVSSSAADYTFSVALRAAGRNFGRLVIQENTGSTFVSQYFNLGTGAVGTTGTTGANWSNRRAFISDLGDGWYRCTVVGRKTNAATSLSVFVMIGSADGTDNYTGNNTDGISCWRATLAQSSVPTRLMQTTSAATSGTSQTGSALYLKGLPASTSGLLLPEDCFEINGEIKTATAALNSDAAGLGYLQFEPALVRSPSDNDPVIITDPMGKFLMSSLKVDNEFGTQAIVTYDLEHIYE